jgi:hypothetical protein
MLTLAARPALCGLRYPMGLLRWHVLAHSHRSLHVALANIPGMQSPQQGAVVFALASRQTNAEPTLAGIRYVAQALHQLPACLVELSGLRLSNGARRDVLLTKLQRMASSQDAGPPEAAAGLSLGDSDSRSLRAHVQAIQNPNVRAAMAEYLQRRINGELEADLRVHYLGSAPSPSVNNALTKEINLFERAVLQLKRAAQAPQPLPNGSPTTPTVPTAAPEDQPTSSRQAAISRLNAYIEKVPTVEFTKALLRSYMDLRLGGLSPNDARAGLGKITTFNEYSMINDFEKFYQKNTD